MKNSNKRKSLHILNSARKYCVSIADTICVCTVELLGKLYSRVIPFYESSLLKTSPPVLLDSNKAGKVKNSSTGSVQVLNDRISLKRAAVSKGFPVSRILLKTMLDSDIIYHLKPKKCDWHFWRALAR